MTAGQATATPTTPVFSERLTAVLEAVVNGEAPNSGRFCGHCYTPLGAKRERCRQCGTAVSERRPVRSIPEEVVDMFRRLRQRESLIVNSLAYVGLMLAVLLFIAIFYVAFMLNASMWWYIATIVFLFISARVFAGLLGGFVGDELGFRYARRRLAEEWRAYEAERESATGGVDEG